MMAHDPSSDKVRIIEAAFRPIMDKLWHRIYFPFGTFLYTVTAQMPEDFKKCMKGPCNGSQGDGKHLTNPFSVSHADILYMMSTTGYIKRFTDLCGILVWAMKNGCNLLIHNRFGKRMKKMKRNSLDQFYTLEKYLHVFGSIFLLDEVMEKNCLNTNWELERGYIQKALKGLCEEFSITNTEIIRSSVKNMTVNVVEGSIVGIQNFFRQAHRISEPR